MYNLFKNYNPYSVIALLIITVVCKLSYLLSPQLPIVTTDNLLWGSIVHFLQSRVFGDAYFLYTLTAVLMIFGQALYLNKVCNRHHLFARYSYLPALGYILITSFFSQWNYLSIHVISNWFIIAMIDRVLKLYLKQDAGNIIMSIGFSISMMTLLYVPNVFYLLLFTFSTASLRTFKLREWLIGITGFVIPIYLIVGILFLTDKLFLLRGYIDIDWYFPTIFPSSLSFFVALIFVLLLLVFGLYHLSKLMSRMVIQGRKYWWVIVIFAGLSLLIAIAGLTEDYSQILGLMIPFSIIFSNIWFGIRKKWLINMWMYAFLLITLWLPWSQ